jgi:hypothetical protein
MKDFVSAPPHSKYHPSDHYLRINAFHRSPGSWQTPDRV